jgi:hypothetical protein
MCGKPFTPDDPASTDHIDPIAEFGPRLPTNDRVQAVHRSCNSRRARLREKQAHARYRAEHAESDEVDAEFDQPPPPRRRVGSSRYPRVWEGALAIPLTGPARYTSRTGRSSWSKTGNFMFPEIAWVMQPRLHN